MLQIFSTSIMQPSALKYSKKSRLRKVTTIFILINKRGKNGKCCINPNGSTFYLSPAGPAEVEKIIDEINVKKSTGPFGVPVFLLKKFKNFFSLWLSELVNLSFETGIFPDVLKVAKVNPLHKKDSKIDHRNYRPISLLCN